MMDLIRNWLLDPVALLFILSLMIGLSLLRKRAYKSRSRDPRDRRKHRGRRRIFAPLIWIASYLFATAPVIVNPLVANLEDQYSDGSVCEVSSHIVVLGGGVDSRLLAADEFERMSNATMARTAAAARLATAESDSILVVAGGANRRVTEADVIADFLVRLGVSESRIRFESQSHSTVENAANVAKLLGDETIDGPIRLVTSAMHMPRAAALFEKQGMDICAVAVDRQAIPDVPAWALMPQTTALVKFDRWLHETVAMAFHRWQGDL